MSHTGQSDAERMVRYQAWFWRTDHPLATKFAVEKAIRMLLAREPADDGALVFRGTSSAKDPVYRSRLCLEAVESGRHLYSLQMEAAASGKWLTQEKLEQMAGKAWQAWIGPLHVIAPPPLSFDRELYRRVVSETLAREVELASVKEDEAPIQAARQAVIDGLRRGKRCIEGNKEGNTTFRFDGRQFARGHIGEWEENVVFDGTEGLLADIRKFYDWDTRRATYPHSPPEVDVWRFILSRLR